MDINLQAYIKAFFEHYGHVVTATADRNELIKLIPDFQVTIFDPDGLVKETGADVVAKLRWSKCTCPIIVLSKKKAWSDKVQAFNSGANDYLTKPFENEELLGRAAMLAHQE
ncbi:MAG: response regulator [Patescibacteria group bacterium]